MPNPADAIAQISCQPDTNVNLLEFNILKIRVRVALRDSNAAPPFRVVIRTNINQGRRICRQIIDRVEKGQSYSTDFYDITAQYDSTSGLYGVDILLCEVGYFEYKVRVESTDPMKPWVRWADGVNIGISVNPLEYGRNNSLYCAFIRQFGPDKHKPSLASPELEQTIQSLEAMGSHVLPPSGNFEHFKEALPFIINELGMKIIHLLPINPVPTSYGRMGMYGSPYANTDYFGIDPVYGTFSRYKTIEDQFIDVTSTIHGLGAKVIIDMVINHTGWASSLHFTHRNWRKVSPDGQIKSPGAWGVVWGDLVELDYTNKDLWQYMANVFLVWCRRGIDGYRLDAGYMVPKEVWKYIISKVREEFPNTMFLLEGLGGPWATTEDLLTDGQMNWAYSELFQNYSRPQITDYLRYAQKVSGGKGVLVHYAETHDNDRLAKKGKIYTRMRLCLSAFTAASGAWGLTNGVEWLATEKIDVHRNTGLNWGNADNLVADIAGINRILAENPAFWERDNLAMMQVGDDEVFAFVRRSGDNRNVVAGLINLNVEAPKQVTWDWSGLGMNPYLEANPSLHDLLSDTRQDLPPDKKLRCDLAPGACRMYRLEPANLAYQPFIPAIFDVDYNRIALIYHILLSRFHPHRVSHIDQEKLLRQVTDFRRFITLVNTCTLARLIHDDIAAGLSKITDEETDEHSAVWTFAASNKEFIISGDKWLVVQTFVPCTAYLKTAEGQLARESIASPDGVGHVVFFPPQPENESYRLTFNWKIRRGQMIQRQWQNEDYRILSVPSGRQKPKLRKLMPLLLTKNQLHKKDYTTVLLTNGIGALSQTPALPHIVNSKYDALFCVTPNPEQPSNRLALVKTLFETVQVGQKYFDLDESFLVNFSRYPYPSWEFEYDDGEYHLRLERTLLMARGHNTLLVRYKLREANTTATIFSKCFLECRNPHDQILAGPNEALRRTWEGHCHILDDAAGLQFTAHPKTPLTITAKYGEYIHQPNWTYNMQFPQDAERGLQTTGDAFSPGVFRLPLTPDKSDLLKITTEPHSETISTAVIEMADGVHRRDMISDVAPPAARGNPYVRMLLAALDHFIVQTPVGWQLVAGYPWLPVMTRPALQSVGGLLMAGRWDVAEDIILRAAQSEKNGLLADILDRPSTYENLESSLRLFLAAADFVGHTGHASLWDTPVGDGRTLREILITIYEQMVQGAPCGAGVDRRSGMLYCPAGFSWMNSQYPQATPRAGYPVEIQAFWGEALPILAQIFPPYAEEALELRSLLDQHFLPYFWRHQRGWLADVLTAGEKIPAIQALPDPGLRFNQLMTIQAGMVPIDHARQIVDVIGQRLVVPAALRTLAEDPLAVPLTIIGPEGKLLANPRMPYQGHCEGDETARRVAYHNGTAWPSFYPLFIEARAVAYGYSQLAVRQALAFFEPVWSDLLTGGVGTLSEMKDGNYPHTFRGCYAYAPAVAESLRVYMQLRYPNNPNHNHTHENEAGDIESSYTDA